MTFKIEKGVPVPHRGKAAGPCPFPFAEMALGDSFVVPTKGDDEANAARSKLLNQAKRYRDEHSATFAITTGVDPQGIRCWRVEFREHKRKTTAAAPLTPAVVHRLATSEDDDEAGRRVQGTSTAWSSAARAR